MLEAIIIEQANRASIVDTRPAPEHLTTTPSWTRPVTRGCIVAESNRQSLEVIKLLSVLTTEGGRVGQFVRNTNGSYDIGPMQINTIHLPALAKTFGIESSQIAQLLAYDGCFNVSVGAWMLRQRTNEANGDFWYGIGRYHSKTNEISTKYILLVHSVMVGLVLSAKQIATKTQITSNWENNSATLVANKGN